MKKTMTRLALMTLALMLALSQIAFAEPSDSVKAVYEAMMAEDSDFAQSQAVYAEYYDGVTMDAALEDNGITITLTSENEYVESGSWTFVEDGDYLTAILDTDDYYGASMAMIIRNAAVSAQGVNTTLYNGYLSALMMTDQENKYFLYKEDEAAGTTTFSINIVGPYEMEGLDELVLTEDVLNMMGYEPMDEDYTSSAINFGKVSLIVNGNVESATFLVMEYGELDDLALQAVACAVKTMQPNGWEDFVANYTEMKDAQEENYTATLNLDEDAVLEFIEDPAEGYAFATITIGQTN